MTSNSRIVELRKSDNIDYDKIGFPLLFDQQPRPVAVDIPIEIPDRNKAPALKPPVAMEPTPVAAALPATAPASVPAVAVIPVPKTEEILPSTPNQPPPKPVDEGSRVQALLEAGEPPRAASAPESAQRYVVQFGAFADAARAQEVRLKVERAGLKTYTHVADTKEGRRTRVRVGPFATKAEADRAAEKIRRLELPATVLTL
jgi:DedD protein